MSIPFLSSSLPGLSSKLSLGTQIAALGALLCFVVVLVAATIAGTSARSHSELQVKSSLQAVAGGFAERLEYRMYERYREIRNLEAIIPLDTMWTQDPAGVEAVLEQLQKTFIDYAWIGFARPDGTVAAATNGLLVGASVAERPWFIEGLKAPAVGDLHDAKLLANLLEPNASGEPFRFVDVSVPVRDVAGQIVGVLGAHLSWEWALRTRSALLKQLPGGTQTEVWILRSTGEVILGPATGTKPLTDDQIAQVRRDRSSTFALGEDLLSLRATEPYLDYPGLGWIVVAKSPLAAAMAPAEALFRTILKWGTLVALVGAVAVAVLATKLTQPVRELALDVDGFGREMQRGSIRRSDSSSDLVKLTTAVRALVRRVGSAEEALESTEKSAGDAVARLQEKNRRLGQDVDVLRTLAETDSLTGLLNRRAFNVFAGDTFNHFKRYKRGFATLVVDIDFFKRVNDTYGHAVGDEIIKLVGSIISGSVRTTDKVARFGGEEFVVLLREVEPAAAAALAERIRQSVAASVLDTEAYGPVHVTISVGVAFAAETDRDISDIIERADHALYAAKATGRNRVATIWPETAHKKAA